MTGLPLILVFIFLAAVDLAAGFVATGRIGVSDFAPVPVSIATHLVVVVLASVAIRIYPGAKQRPGYRTLGLLAATICLLSPVVGCLVAAWLVAAGARAGRGSPLRSAIRFGNPVTAAASLSRSGAPAFTEPLIEALRQGHRPVQRLAAPLLRLTNDRRALAILRDLKDQSDARTHLYAQAALATSAERRQHQLSGLRRRASVADSGGVNEAFVIHEQLASALCETARLDPPNGRIADAAPLYEEALGSYVKALAHRPADPACLFGKARCLIKLGRLDEVPDLYGRLCALPGAIRLAEGLEVAYFAAVGNWKRTGEAVQRISRENVLLDLGAARRQFWLLPHATRSASATSGQRHD